jgi:hypothetical protein
VRRMVTDLGSSKGGLRELLWLTGTAVLISRRHDHYPSPLEGLFQSRVSRCPVFGDDPPGRQYHPVVFSRVQRLAGTEGVEGFADVSLRSTGLMVTLWTVWKLDGATAILRELLFIKDRGYDAGL